MNQIRAFVGHSFAEQDRDLVQKFLAWFREIERLRPNFTWDTAESAEPSGIAQKVLRIFDDKNLFISICTKKERVVPDYQLRQRWLRRNFIQAEENSFEWKASDWAIQEIGLAMGKRLPIILLLENGVRQPGELQSDLQYIPFDRNAPEKIFNQIAQMIASQLPRGHTEYVTSPPPRPAEQEPENVNAKMQENYTPRPQANWSLKDYQIALTRAIATNDTAREEEVTQAYLKTDDARERGDSVTWEADREYRHISLGKGGSFQKLEAMARLHPESSGVIEYVARAQEHYREYDAAAKTYEMAALNATGSNRVRLLGRAAVSYSKDSAQDAAFRMLNKMREPIAGAENSEQIFLEAQLELCEKFGIHQFRIAVMERIAEKNPGDIELRSRLAHLHLSVGSNDLALYHYLKIPEYVRDNNAWNNLGVANDRLELPAKGIEAYERSEALGETRATSNLALSLINAGFLTEAERRCRAALQVADCDENVGTTLAGVRKVVESENKKEDGLLTNAKRKSEFYRAVGRASALPLPADISGVWKGRNCSLIVKMVGNTFSASGSYVQPRNGLGALSIGFGTSLPPARMREEYTGSFLGRSIAASVTRTRDDDLPTTLLGSLDKRIDVQLLLNDDCTELNVMEGPQSPHPQFYSLFRGEM